jgi:hypothetical protein
MSDQILEESQDLRYWIDVDNSGQAFPKHLGCATRDQKSKEYAAKFNHPSNTLKRNESANV